MNRPDLFNKTLDTLVSAYHRGTLLPGFVCGCAVGNIVLDSYNVRPTAEQVLTRDRIALMVAVSTAKGITVTHAGAWTALFRTAAEEDEFGHVPQPPVYRQETLGLTMGNDPLLCHMLQDHVDLISRVEYTMEELARIEYVFETTCDPASGVPFDRRPLSEQSEVSYRGLMAVVDELMNIHEMDAEPPRAHIEAPAERTRRMQTA